MDFEKLYKNIEYKFREISILREALTHPSVVGNKPNYERLELLGDAILSFVITEILVNKYKSANEGKISQIRSRLICRENLVRVSKKLELDKFIIMSAGEEKTGGRSNKSNLENVMESIIGAIYSDSGDINVIKNLVHIYWAEYLEVQNSQIQNIEHKDAKTLLQEEVQKFGTGLLPKYNTLSVDFIDGKHLIKVSVEVLGYEAIVESGENKKIAEQKAASRMLGVINFKKNL